MYTLWLRHFTEYTYATVNATGRAALVALTDNKDNTKTHCVYCA